MGFNEQPNVSTEQNLTQGMLGFLRAYLGWSIETNVSKLSNIKMSFYLFIAILCAKMSSVYRPLN
jgi:hypothetical protein